MKNKNLILGFVFAALLLVVGILGISNLKISSNPNESSVQGISNDFVKYSNTAFTYLGKPYRVAGTNNHYIAWASHQEVDNVLNDAKAMNLNVVRTFASVVRGSIDNPTSNSKSTIWNWNTYGDPSNMGMEGTYFMYWNNTTNAPAYNDGPDGLQKMDYLIYKAKSLNIKLQIALIDFWGYTGGLQQIGSWYGGTDATKYHFVFDNPNVKQAYKNWVSHLLNHVNSYNGIAYKDEPAIFGWDLANEPAADSKPLLRSWVTEMSSFVKSIDKNHLLASGSEGFINGQSGGDPSGELNIPTIDFGTWHIYPAYAKVTPAQVVDLVKLHCDIAKNAQKPVLWEEFGYGFNHADQPEVYASWTNAVINNSDCAGYTFWRLVSKENNGKYPRDNGEKFDLNIDSGPVILNLLNSALAMTKNNADINSISSSSSSSTNSSSIITSSSVDSSSSNSSSSSSSSINISSSSSSIQSSSSSVTSSSSSSNNIGFVKGINLGGDSVKINNNNWLSYLDSLKQGMKVNSVTSTTLNIDPVVQVDPQTALMLKSLLTIDNSSSKISLSIPLSSGNYQFYIWVYEGYQSNSRLFNLDVNYRNVDKNLGNLKLGEFKKYGPYITNVTGSLNIDLKAVKSRPVISGIEIYTK